MPAQVATGAKRKAIADSNRAMFLWVAAMSAVLGVCVVISIFLVQQIIFKGKVVAEMSKTAKTLTDNNKAAPELTQNIRVLETNAALNSVKANDEQKALQVVLDALPADRNTLALGSSLQQNLLADIGGLTLNSLSIDNATTTQSSDENTIPLQFQVTSADANTMKDMLTKLERSIRTIDIDSLILERGDTSYRISVSGHAYYAPAKTIQLTEKVVKP